MGELFDRLERAASAALREDWTGFLEPYADDVEAWSPAYDVKGRDAWLEAIKAQNGPFEVRQELWLIAETENTVVAEWTWSIPHTDGSGRWVTLPGLSYFVFDEGRIAKLRQYFDLAAFLAEFQEDAPAAGN